MNAELGDRPVGIVPVDVVAPGKVASLLEDLAGKLRIEPMLEVLASLQGGA